MIRSSYLASAAIAALLALPAAALANPLSAAAEPCRPLRRSLPRR